MYYVYTLSFDGIIFYIGCTKHPLIRYKQHTSGNDRSTCTIIYNKAANGLMPGFNIVHHSPDRFDALKRERFLISLYSKINHKLTNIDYNSGNILSGSNERDNLLKKPRFKFNYSLVEFYITTYINNIV